MSQSRDHKRYHFVDAAQEATIGLKIPDSRTDLEAVFVAEYPRVARTIARITRDPGCAEELAVEVFLRLSARPAALAADAAPWLFRTAVRLALDEVRRRNRSSRLQEFFRYIKAPRNPEEIHSDRDRQDKVARVLSHLRRRDAELLILRAEGMAYEELATALSINPASVGTLLSRAQQVFRKEYVKRYGQPD